MKRYDVETLIKTYLAREGVDKFWVSSALTWIRRGLAGNGHFVTDVVKMNVKVNKDYQFVDTFTGVFLASFPDQGRDGVRIKINYSFNKVKHSLSVKS